MYDRLNRVTQIVDALGGVTRFGYDPNGNLLAVTDARGNMTTHSYDALDRRTTATYIDATVSDTHDLSGRLVEVTDSAGREHLQLLVLPLHRSNRARAE